MSTLTSQTLFRGAIFAILTLATTATMPVNQAAAEYRPIGAVSKSSLKASCAASGGHFEAANSGEFWCEKNGTLVDCNGHGQCIGGTPLLASHGGGAGAGFATAQGLAKSSASFLKTVQRKVL